MSIIEEICKEKSEVQFEEHDKSDVWGSIHEFDIRFGAIRDLLEMLEEIIIDAPGEIDKQCAMVVSIRQMIASLDPSWETVFA